MKMWRSLLAHLFFLFIASVAHAQTLSVQGDRFALDGAPKFLVFISYFDGVRRISNDLSSTALDTDLAYFASKGISGIRVFPNWYHPSETLMQADGALRPLQLDKLKRLIDRAAAAKLVVDVSFARETVSGLRVDTYGRAIRETAAALKGKDNVLFDLQNESDNHAITADELRAIKNGVKAVDPTRLVTASFTGGYSVPDAASFVRNHGFDILAYHEGRDPDGKWATSTPEVVAALRRELTRSTTTAAPIYLQEPNRFGPPRTYYDNNEAHYLTAVRNAKSAGAAAWTFHNDPTRDLSSATPFRDLLQPGERKFLDELAPAIR